MLTWFLTVFFEWLFEKLAALVAGAARVAQKRDDIRKEAEASVEPLKGAESAEEIDKAADDALNGL